MTLKRTWGLLAFLAVVLLSSCNECKKVECLNDGICEEGICECPEGFMGELCEIEDKCITEEVECGANGECIDGVCDCRTSYYGESCGDYCLEGTYSNGSCTCFQGYEGENCDVLSREEFLGTYFVTSSEGGANRLSAVTEGDWTTQEKWKVTLPNLAFDGDTDGWGEVNGNNITFPDQIVNGNSSDTFGISVEMIEGGTLVDDGIEVMFTLKVRSAIDTVGAEVTTETLTFTRASSSGE
ncbi:MAG: hypothetical protein Salg2KO_18260 [Salibacteraceae bacterium]